MPESPDSPVGVCDIGGTNLRVALADRQGKLLARRAVPHATRDAGAIIDTAARELLTLANVRGAALRGVGVSVPGPLDPARGVVHFSPNLGWHDVPLAQRLEERLGVPVALDDDANCAALGEHAAYGDAAPRDFVYIVIGTGIGGGLIFDGELYRGASGSAGEIGHTTIVSDGPRCTCGNRGCLEALAAGPALVRRARELGTDYANAGELIAAARAGEAIASQALGDAARYLGIGLANLVNSLNPAAIALGGGVALDAREMLLDPAVAEMRGRAFASAASAVRVELARLGEDASLVGAARLILRRGLRA